MKNSTPQRELAHKIYIQNPLLAEGWGYKLCLSLSKRTLKEQKETNRGLSAAGACRIIAASINT